MRGKKLWNAVMAGMLCVSMLAGCGAKTENAPSEPAASEAAQTGEQESTEKAVEESAEAAGETPYIMGEIVDGEKGITLC